MLLHGKHKSLFLLVLIMVCSSTLNAQNVEVLVTGIRSTKGQLSISVFKDNDSFKNDNPFEIKSFDKTNVSNGAMTVKFTLKPGIYGLALLDDENNNNEMDYSFWGMPEEGFGFSNYYLSGLTRPSFDLFKFVLNKDQSQKIIIKIRYI